MNLRSVVPCMFTVFSLVVVCTSLRAAAGRDRQVLQNRQTAGQCYRRSVLPLVSAEETLEILAFMEADDESKRRGGQPVTISSVMEKNRNVPSRKTIIIELDKDGKVTVDNNAVTPQQLTKLLVDGATKHEFSSIKIVADVAYKDQQVKDVINACNAARLKSVNLTLSTTPH